MVKLFAHRGFTQNKFPQNSILSLKNAIDHGYQAIEFDIWYFQDELLLSHDMPKDNPQALPRFADYLTYGNNIEYWIDFKNLDLHNIYQVIAKIRQDFQSQSINLEKIFFAPFITDYKLAIKIWNIFYEFFGREINVVGVCDNSAQLPQIIDFLNHRAINYVSIFHELIDQYLIQNIDSNCILAWTVNNDSRLRKLATWGINKFATDDITPRDI